MREMQETLTLRSKSFSVRETREFQGWSVPWEGAGYAEDFRLSGGQGGFFDLSHWGLVEIEGEDARDYLHRMSTADFRKASTDSVQHGAFLTGRGQLVALGFFQQVDGAFHFLVSPGQSASTAEHIEKFHFAERLTVADKSEEWALFGLWSPDNHWRNLFAHSVDTTNTPLKIEATDWNGVSLSIWRDDSRESLFWMKLPRVQAGTFLRELRSAGLPLLGQHLFEYFRIRASVPQIGLEATEKEIVLETGFDRAVARNKGCYPGQEVVERIYTYGSVNRKLLPVELHREGTAEMPGLPFSLCVEGREVGSVVSQISCPEDSNIALGLAYVHRSFWQRHEPFTSATGWSIKLRFPVT